MPIILARKSRLRAKLELFAYAPLVLLGLLMLPFKFWIGLFFLAGGSYSIYSNIKFLRATDPKRVIPPGQAG